MLPLALCMDITGKCVAQIVLSFLAALSLCLPRENRERKLIALRPDSVKDLSCFWAGTIFHFRVDFFVTLEGFGSTVVGKILRAHFE